MFGTMMSELWLGLLLLAAGFESLPHRHPLAMTARFTQAVLRTDRNTTSRYYFRLLRR